MIVSTDEGVYSVLKIVEARRTTYYLTDNELGACLEKDSYTFDNHVVLVTSPDYDPQKHAARLYGWYRADECEVISDASQNNEALASYLLKGEPV